MTAEPTNSIVPRGSPDEDNCGGEDRLSSLPASIICHILSFLPTKFAATTSILSTTWRYIFLSIPKIDLDDSLILYHDQQEEANDDKRAQSLEIFMDLVNRLVNFEKTSIVAEFRLKLSRRVDGNVLVSWVSLILGRNVQVLDIWLTTLANPKPLPIQLFLCKTLVVMKLSGKFLLEIPKLMCLPNLKVLHLEYLVVVCGDNTSWTFSEGCPLLEDLRLDTVQFWTNAFVDISIPSLRKLVWHPLVSDKVDEVVLVINSPNLEYLEYKAREHPNCSICKLNSLVRADLYVGYISLQKELPQQWAEWLSWFLSNICGVKSLSLLLGCLEGLFQSNYPVPKFPNLTCMELMVSFDYHWEWLEILLQHAPNLELLVCDMAGCRYTGEALLYGAQEKPLCLTRCLREVKIKNFCGDEFELQLVKYLLQHGATLEMVSICPSLIGMPKGCQPLIREKLLKFSRCSKNCNIVFVE